MSRTHWWAAVIALGLMCWPVLGLADAQTVRNEVEAAAGKMRWLETSWILYDRDNAFGGPVEMQESIAVLQGLLHGSASAEDTLPLLKHENPKVRTLAMAILAYRDYPMHLDEIAPLCGDEAQTLPAPGHLSMRLGGDRPKEWPARPQKVHDVAKAIIAHHLEVARDSTGNPWDPYWAKRKTRPYGLADYVVMWERATQGVSPLQPGREQQIKAALERLNALPMPDRFLATMKLRASASSGVDYLPDQKQMLEMARQLPREQRLKLIQGRRISEDAEAAFGTGAAGSFVLDHAAVLLEANDVPMLLDRERQSRQDGRNWRTPMGPASPKYAIAAADLRPDAARSILRAALERFVDYNNDNRRELAVALFRLGTKGDLPYLTHQFFSLVPERGAFPGNRVAMLQACRQIDEAKYQHLVYMIVWDLRLADLGPPSVREMMQDVGRWTGQPLVKDEEVRSSMGIDESLRDGPFRPLEDWKDRLRRAMEELEKKNPALGQVDWDLDFRTGL